MIVGVQRAAGLRDAVGAQCRRRVQCHVGAERGPMSRRRQFLAQFAGQGRGVALPRRHLAAGQFPQPGHSGGRARWATRSEAPEISAPATTIWFGIAATVYGRSTRLGTNGATTRAAAVVAATRVGQASSSRQSPGRRHRLYRRAGVSAGAPASVVAERYRPGSHALGWRLAQRSPAEPDSVGQADVSNRRRPR